MWSRFARNVWRTIEKDGLLCASFFLLVFIPLYPKLPLFDIIPGYLVRVRIEDLLVFATTGCWIIQCLRGKVNGKNPFQSLLFLYLVVGVLSVVSGIFLLQTIPLELLHVGKSGLHYLRYLEYFSLLFLLFSSIRTLKQAQIAVFLLASCVSAATLYGFGQKYWSWPVYSTMNREFSKGVALTLSEDARLNSTFGGHYDLAAYLVIVIPILWAVVLTHRRWQIKILMASVIAAGCWLLIASGSKTALLAWVLGMAITTLLFIKRYQRVFKVSMILAMVSLLLSSVIVGYFWLSPQNTFLITQLKASQKNPLILKVPPAQQTLQKLETVFLNHTATRLKPYDLTGEDRFIPVNSLADDGSITQILVKKDEDWSENSLTYGLSMGIRLDTLWPQALKGVAKNLYLGSGYGTLNKTLNGAFIEADSTDNNFLRTLGETGILGWLIFYGLIWFAWRRLFIGLNHQSWVTQSLSLGLIGGTIGLLANALIIDVFAASKVAFTFWAVLGIATKAIYLSYPHEMATKDARLKKNIQKIWQKSWPLLVAGLIVVFLIHRNPGFTTSRILNFSDYPSATSALTTAKCWLETQQWQLCRGDLTLSSSTSYLYGGYLTIFYQLWPAVGLFYYLNLILAVSSFYFFYKLSQKNLSHPTWVLAALLLEGLVLFLSPVIYSPVDANATLLIGLWSVLSWQLWQISKHKKWLILSGLCLGGVITTLPSFGWPELTFTIAPAAIILILKTLQSGDSDVWTSLKYPKGITLAITIFFIFSLILLEAPQRLTQVVAEYQGLSESYRLEAVQTANNYFTTRASLQEDAPDVPHLLTVTNPYYYDLNRNQEYQLLPLSPQQGFAKNSVQVWGDYDYTSPQATAHQFLRNRIPIFMSDFDLTTTVGVTEFNNLKKDLNLDVVALGCQEKCNIYQIFDQSERLLTTTSFNNLPLELDERNDYTFNILSHRFNVNDARYNHETKDFAETLNQVTQVKPDFMILTGSIFKANEDAHRQTFMKLWKNQSQLPFYFLPGNYDEVIDAEVGEHFQSFTTPHSLFVLLDFDQTGTLNPQQQLAVYNLALDLEKQPQVKNIFLISHSLKWLGSSHGYEPLSEQTYTPTLSLADNFFQTSLIPKFSAFKDKKIYVVSGDLQPQASANLFYEVNQVNNVTYIASAVNNHQSDVYLQVRVANEGEVSFTPISVSGQRLESISNYGVTYWKSQFPTLQTPVAPPAPDSQFRLLLRQIGWAIVIGSVLTLGMNLATVIKNFFRKRLHY